MRLPGAVSAGGCACSADPVGELSRLFVSVTQKTRALAGQTPVRRAVFLKEHGVAHATFEVDDNLPDELRVGVLRHDSFPAWVRFSSEVPPGYPDAASTLGVALKLFDVPGEKLLERDALTQDFLFQNFDVFFVDNAYEMCEFTCAGVQNHDYDSYLDSHAKTKQILADMAKDVGSVLDIDYWSALPSSFGKDRYVKYMLAPIAGGPPAPPPPAVAASDYLAAELAQRLLSSDARFRFCVQLQTDPARMPLDRATVRWEETDSPFVQVATLRIPQQDIGAPGQAAYGENLSYSAWHSLPEHSPVGSIQDARREVYAASAKFRRDANGVPLSEPREGRQPS